MNINGFFLLILVCLIAIYVAFDPLEIQEQETGEIPAFELSSFVINEFNKDGLMTVMQGSHGVRFSDHYKVNDINYTDNSRELMANIKAKKGIYKDSSEVLDLKGDVIYERVDGLNFQTQKLIYNKKTSIATTKTPYVMYINSNKITGSSLVYNNELREAKSKNITVKYKLKEEKR